MFETIIVATIITTFIFVTVLYFASLYLQDASIMDIFWGLGFILNTAVALYLSYKTGLGLALPKLIIALLIVIWGVRLFVHILMRHREEDPRYVAWRVAWGSNYWWRSYLQIFLLQGALMLIILTPVILFIGAKGTLTDAYSPIILCLGIIIWLKGFLFETIADWQLERFRENAFNRGKLLMSGLWKYSRHPNYFGEALQWWGIFVCTLCVVSPLVAPWYVLVVGPLTITILVRFVSGVPMTEQRMFKNSHFSLYARKTNTFIPWFVRR